MIKKDWSWIFWPVILGFSVGIFLGSINNSLFYIVISVILILIILGYWRARFSNFYSILIFCTLLIVGLFYVKARIESPHPDLLGVVGEEVNILGTITQTPEIKNSNSRYVVSVENVNGDSIGEKIKVYSREISDFNYGDKVLVKGELVLPKAFLDEKTERFFNWPGYLSKDGIHFEIFANQVDLVKRGENNFLVLLNRFWLMLNNKLHTIFPEPTAGLASGILLGAKNSLSGDLNNDFRIAGLSHMVVLSGYNVSVLILFFGYFLRKFSIKLRGLLLIIFILVFVLMAGASAPIVRASIMAGSVVLAGIFGRSGQADRALGLSIFVMLIWNPLLLKFDPSFQLSFLATAGLIYVSPIISNLLPIDGFWLKEIISVTLAAQIAVTPLLLYLTGSISLVSLPANLMILPFVPLVMFFLFASLLSSFISPFLSLFLSLPAYLLLKFFISTAGFWSNLPFATINFDKISIWIIVLLYFAIIIFVYKKASHTKNDLMHFS